MIEQWLVDGIDETVNAWVVRRGNFVTVLLTNHALPHHSIQTGQVRTELNGAPEPRAARIERIDEGHAHPKKVWQEMGGPEYPSAVDVEHLQAVSRLAPEPHPCQYEKQSVHLEIQLPPHAVAAVTLEFAPDSFGGGK